MKTPNYQNSYWKAIVIQEKIECGEIKICKRDAPIIIDLMRIIADAAFKGEN